MSNGDCLCLHFFMFSLAHRYDDTNPEAEKKEYIDHIEEVVGWMGWKPFKVKLCFNLIYNKCTIICLASPQYMLEFRR